MAFVTRSGVEAELAGRSNPFLSQEFMLFC